MQHSVAFWLTGKAVALNVGNSNAKAYFLQSGWYSISFLFQASLLLFKSGWQAYVPIHLNVEAYYHCKVQEWHLCYHIAQTTLQLGVNWRWICWNIHIPINVSIITPWKSTTSRSLGINTFNHPWTYQMSYVFPPSLVPLVLSKFLAEHVTGLFIL